MFRGYFLGSIDCAVVVWVCLLEMEVCNSLARRSLNSAILNLQLCWKLNYSVCLIHEPELRSRACHHNLECMIVALEVRERPKTWKRVWDGLASRNWPLGLSKWSMENNVIFVLFVLMQLPWGSLRLYLQICVRRYGLRKSCGVLETNLMHITQGG